VEVVPNALLLCTFDAQFKQQTIQRVSHNVTFALALATPNLILHRARLVEQENEACGIGTTNLS
jgi:hypothetical protein